MMLLCVITFFNQAIEIMDFASEQWEEGMRDDACKNYHAGQPHN
jgi:hypothetical protein